MIFLPPTIMGSAKIPVPSYANPGGTGNRTATITVLYSSTTLTGAGTTNGSVMVNGGKTASGGDAAVFNTGANSSSKWMRFQFAADVLITEVTYTQDAAVSQGVWQWQGSPDGTTFTNIGSSFTLGASNPQVHNLSANTVGYLYYRMVGVSGSTVNTNWTEEFEFKLDTTA